MPNKKIKFIYFDIGGVLFNWKDAVKLLAAHIDRPYERVFDLLKKYDDEVCRGTYTPDELWQFYKEEFNLNIKMEDFSEWWTNSFKPINEMHEFAKELSEKYRIGLLTNIYSGIYVKIAQKGHVPDLPYKVVVQSCEVHLIKPEKRFFLYAQEKSGFSPEEIAFIDDSEKNLEEAKKIGWKTFKFVEEDTKNSIDEIRRQLLF